VADNNVTPTFGLSPDGQSFRLQLLLALKKGGFIIINCDLVLAQAQLATSWSAPQGYDTTRNPDAARLVLRQCMFLLTQRIADYVGRSRPCISRNLQDFLPCLTCAQKNFQNMAFHSNYISPPLNPNLPCKLLTQIKQVL
jgi:hypothetical protein